MLYKGRTLVQRQINMKRLDIKEQEDSFQAYFAQIKNIPLLSFEEELELSKLIQNGNEAARRRLIEANLRLVAKIAQAYFTPDVSMMDIIQEGNIGLMHAADKYSYLKNVRFSTYAGWWIRQSINRYLANKRRTIRLPQRKEDTLRRIQRTYHSLSQRLSRQPRVEEMAKEIGVSSEEIEWILTMTNGFVTLEMDGGNEEYNILMDVYEDYTYSPEQVLIRQSSKDATLKVLKTLKARERRILMYRYQFSVDEPHTLKKIGAKMGLSPETVRQIEIRALKKIRTAAEELRPFQTLAM